MDNSEDAIRLLAQRLLDIGAGDMPARERRVLERMAKRLAVSRNVNVEFEKQLTFGDRLADQVAEVGGSWSFIIGFGAIVAFWMLVNAALLAGFGGAFDPYPFIFLNLMLSLLAAIQAPVIMMSQNRQAAKDRLAAAHDYEVNLKSEIEIAALHEKLDQIRTHELALLMERIETRACARERIALQDCGKRARPRETESAGGPLMRRQEREGHRCGGREEGRARTSRICAEAAARAALVAVLAATAGRGPIGVRRAGGGGIGAIVVDPRRFLFPRHQSA